MSQAESTLIDTIRGAAREFVATLPEAQDPGSTVNVEGNTGVLLEVAAEAIDAFVTATINTHPSKLDAALLESLQHGIDAHAEITPGYAEDIEQFEREFDGDAFVERWARLLLLHTEPQVAAETIVLLPSGVELRYDGAAEFVYRINADAEWQTFES